MTAPQRLRSGFNRLAPVYDFVVTLLSFNYIQRSQVWVLTKPLNYSNALVFGGGTGKFLVELMKQYPGKRYCYIDISDKMIEAAKKKTQQGDQQADSVQFIQGSYMDIPVNEKFDLIVTNFILDCFTEAELPLVLDSLDKHLTANGAWLFVDFNIPEKRTARLFSSFIMNVLYTGFNILCGLGVKKLPDFKTAFSNLGYEAIHEKYFFAGLLVARIYKRKE